MRLNRPSFFENVTVPIDRADRFGAAIASAIAVNSGQNSSAISISQSTVLPQSFE
jgi:hypothetical protein